MSTKFEQLLDYLVNEEMDKANELFHEIVVEKSREIYENLIAEEADEDMEEAADEEADESVDEGAEEDDEEMDESADDEMDESADEEADESVDLEDSYMMDGDDDQTDDLGGDVGADDMGGDDMGDDGEEKSEDAAIMDIKNAIAELEAAFADLQQAQGGEMDGDMGAEPAFGNDDEADTDEMMGFQEGRRMTREYRETVAKPSGDVAGANTGEKMPSANAGKSPISSGKGKPTTGADAKNILGKSATSNEDGTSPKGKVGGVVKSGGEFTKGVEKNISGSASAKMKSGSDLSKQGAGYPGNNKSAGPVGSGTGDKAGQTSVSNDKSLLKHIN